MTPAQWLLLDNLRHGWPYRTGLDSRAADDAWGWAFGAGYVDSYGLTPSGLAALLAWPGAVADYRI